MEYIGHYEPILGQHIWLPHIQNILDNLSTKTDYKINPPEMIGKARATCSMHPDDR